MGFYDTSVLGTGGAWLEPSRMGHNMVWKNPWPADVTAELILTTNPNGTITKSDLELSVLVIQEATFFKAVPKACIDEPISGSDNTPTISWSMNEASTINPVVVDLLRICAFHSKNSS